MINLKTVLIWSHWLVINTSLKCINYNNTLLYGAIRQS